MIIGQERIGALQFSVLLLRGENAPMPTRIIAEDLSELISNNRLMVIDGAGHMGPLTHVLEVSRLMVRTSPTRSIRESACVL
jgi:hypothetical protein